MELELSGIILFLAGLLGVALASKRNDMKRAVWVSFVGLIFLVIWFSLYLVRILSLPP